MARPIFTAVKYKFQTGVCYCHADFYMFQFKNLAEYTTVIPTLGQLQQEDCEAARSLDCTANLSTAWAT